jgi:RHS repeat-associated protein
MQYTGQRVETSLGLLFYNARWYDPAAGRFIQPDTIIPGGVQGLDRYGYVSNNPIRYTDPSGHKACTDDGICSGQAPITAKTYQSILKSYGITTSGEWTLGMLREAYNGVTKVGYALSGVMKNMNSAQAFKYVFGSMKFCSGDCDGYKLGGYYGISHGSTILFKPEVLTGYGVAHELRHSFETRVYDSLGKNVSNAPVNMLTAHGNELLDLFNNHVTGYDSNAGTFVRTMLGYGDCGLQCAYHPLNMDDDGKTAGEDFADMFMNWTYNSFSSDPNGAGAARNDWINRNMADWISYIS